MSRFETLSITACSALETQKTGFSLVSSLYTTPLNLLLRGELGAGKTTFAQGLAKGLGIRDRVVSPSFALEQHYDTSRLVHIDLYRLGPADAASFLQASDDFPYLRLVEWAGTHGAIHGPAIDIHIEEVDRDTRTLHFTLNDLPLPSAAQIQAWYDDVQLQPHIIRHIDAVTDVALRLADHLLQHATFVRRRALEAAARLHDLLRFVDFKTMQRTPEFPATTQQIDRWTELKSTYGTTHELAAKRFLEEKGFPQIGVIVHRHGPPYHGLPPPETIEQKLLSYADKRVLFDRVVTLDERFDDFMVRYGNGKETPEAGAWRQTMKALEKELFPEGAPL